MSILAGTEYDLTVLENKDAVFPLAVNNGPTAYNLTSVSLSFYLKATRSTPDAAAYLATPTVTAPLLGQFSFTIPHSQIPAAGTFWYRVDAGTTRSDTGCGTMLNSLTVTDAAAVATDLDSPITGTNIPAGTTITAVAPGTGYTISNQATATGSSLTFAVSATVVTLLFGVVNVLPV